MIDLNIDQLGSDNENYEQSSIVMKQPVSFPHPPNDAQLTEPEVDIFQLARSIVDRSYSRRRFRRASNII